MSLAGKSELIEVFNQIFPFILHDDYKDGLKVQRKERFSDQACTDSVIVENLSIERPPIIVDPSPNLKDVKTTIDCFHIGKMSF